MVKCSLIFLFCFRGTRATSCQPPIGGLLCPNGPPKPKAEVVSGTLAFSSAVACSSQNSSLQNDTSKRLQSCDKSHNNLGVLNDTSKSVKQFNSMDNPSNAGEKTALSDGSLGPVNSNSLLSSLTLLRDGDRGSCDTSNTANSTDINGQPYSSGLEGGGIAPNEEIQKLCFDLSSANIGRNSQNEYYGFNRSNTLSSDYILTKSPQLQASQQHEAEKFRDEQFSCESGEAAPSDWEQSGLKLNSQAQTVTAPADLEDDIASFDNQRLKDPEVVSHSYMPNSTSFVHVPIHSNRSLTKHVEQPLAMNADFVFADSKAGDDSMSHPSSVLCNGYPDKVVSRCSSGLNSTSDCISLQDVKNGQCIGRLHNELVSAGSDAALDKGESSIISNILSMDFDPWGESLTSPQDLVKMLGDKNESQFVPLKKSSSLKVQNNSQSRFSFARQDDPKIHVFNANPSYEQFPRRGSFVQDFSERDLYNDRKLGMTNGFSCKLEESESLGSGHFVASNKHSGEYQLLM